MVRGKTPHTLLDPFHFPLNEGKIYPPFEVRTFSRNLFARPEAEQLSAKSVRSDVTPSLFPRKLAQLPRTSLLITDTSMYVHMLFYGVRYLHRSALFPELDPIVAAIARRSRTIEEA